MFRMHRLQILPQSHMDTYIYYSRWSRAAQDVATVESCRIRGCRSVFGSFQEELYTSFLRFYRPSGNDASGPASRPSYEFRRATGLPTLHILQYLRCCASHSNGATPSSLGLIAHVEAPIRRNDTRIGHDTPHKALRDFLKLSQVLVERGQQVHKEDVVHKEHGGRLWRLRGTKETPFLLRFREAEVKRRRSL